jgi:hypothetical protein
MTKLAVCKACAGTGKVPYTALDFELGPDQPWSPRCNICHGSGLVEIECTDFRTLDDEWIS